MKGDIMTTDKFDEELSDVEIFDEDMFVADLDEALLEKLEGTEWYDRVAELDLESELDDRVALYQALRKAEVLPDDASFFLLVWAIQAIAEDRSGELYERDFQARFEEMEKKYSIDPDAYLEGNVASVPEDYEALHQEFDKATMALLVATFQAFGEQKIATSFQDDPEAFANKFDTGAEFFFTGEE